MKVLAAIWRHAAHVSRYLSYYFSPNTHLTGEALGLFYAGVLFREFDDAPRWRGRGMHVLLTPRAGGRSPPTAFTSSSRPVTTATRLTSTSTSCCLPRAATFASRPRSTALAAHGRFSARGAPAERIGARDRRCRRRLRCCRSSRRSPGRWTRRCSRRRRRCSIAPTSRGPPRARAGTPVAARARRAWRLSTSCAAAAGSGRVATFATGGYAVMRDGWDDEANQMIVDVGPLGCPVSSGHGHADLLSIQCAIVGEPCLVDAGNYCYTSEAEWRDFFRTTAAHNTVMIDGRSQCETGRTVPLAPAPAGAAARMALESRASIFSTRSTMRSATCRIPSCIGGACCSSSRATGWCRRSRRNVASPDRSDVPVRADARHARPATAGRGRGRRPARCCGSDRSARPSEAGLAIGRSRIRFADGSRPTTASASRRPRCSHARRHCLPQRILTLMIPDPYGPRRRPT